MEKFIKELKRKKEVEIEYQISLSADKLHYTPQELVDKAIELSHSDGRIQMIDDILFFLEEGVWEDEVVHIIKKK